jgi:hypothetical protein
MVDTTIGAERAKLQRLRGDDAGVVEPVHGTDQVVSVVRRTPPAATAPPAPAPARADQRPPEHWLRDPNDSEWRDHVSATGLVSWGAGRSDYWGPI